MVGHLHAQSWPRSSLGKQMWVPCIYIYMYIYNWKLRILQSSLHAVPINPWTDGNAWVHTHHCSYWCPGAKAPGHQYPQCWLKYSFYRTRSVQIYFFRREQWKKIHSYFEKKTYTKWFKGYGRSLPFIPPVGVRMSNWKLIGLAGQLIMKFKCLSLSWHQFYESLSMCSNARV